MEDRLVRQRRARGDAPTIVVWFNASMHDAAPNLGAALAVIPSGLTMDRLAGTLVT